MIDSPSFPLARFFPSSIYHAQCKQEPNAIPHFLIAIKQPYETIIAQIEKRQTDYKESRFLLTAVAVAVLAGDHKVLQYLLEVKHAKPNLMDRAKLTPLHYAAALGDEVSMTLLQGAMKVHMVHLDLFTLFPGWRPIIEPIEVVDERFKEKAQADFCPGVKGRREDLPLFLAHRLEKEKLELEASFISEALLEQLDKPVKLQLVSQEGAGWGVAAGESIPAYRLCGVYGGELDFERKVAKEGFLFECFNASNKRSYAPMVNDGFQNCAYFHIYHPDGPIYLGLVSLQEIKEGEPLYCDYGPNHNIKLNRRVELNYEALVRYFEELPFKEIGEKLSQLSHKIELGGSRKLQTLRYFEYRAHYVRMAYLFHTPSALFTLALHDVEFYKMLSEWVLGRMRLKGLEISQVHMKAIFLFFESLKELHSKLGPKETEALHEILRGHLKLYSWRSVFSQFLYFKRRFIKDEGSIEEMQTQMGPMCELMEEILPYSRAHRNEKIPEKLLPTWKEKLSTMPLDWVKEEIALQAAQFPILKDLL